MAEIIILYIMPSLFVILVATGIILKILATTRAKETTTATIIDIKERFFKYSEENLQPAYAPVLEYYVDGVKYIKESLSSQRENVFQIGQQVQIKYRKNNPEDAYIKEDKKAIITTSIILLILLVMGAIFFIVGRYTKGFQGIGGIFAPLMLFMVFIGIIIFVNANKKNK